MLVSFNFVLHFKNVSVMQQALTNKQKATTQAKRNLLHQRPYLCLHLFVLITQDAILTVNGSMLLSFFYTYLIQLNCFLLLERSTWLLKVSTKFIYPIGLLIYGYDVFHFLKLVL